MNFISQLLFLVLLVTSGYLIYRRVKFIKRNISLKKKKYSTDGKFHGQIILDVYNEMRGELDV